MDTGSVAVLPDLPGNATGLSSPMPFLWQKSGMMGECMQGIKKGLSYRIQH